MSGSIQRLFFDNFFSFLDADLINNEKSIDRSLDKYLYLVSKIKFGSEEHWLFPQEAHQQGESLRGTAERIVQDWFPSKNGECSIHVKFLGNSPAAYYTYRYPPKVAEERGKQGVRLFLFKCDLDRNHCAHGAMEGTIGDRLLKPNVKGDYAWLTREEIEKRMPARYWNSIGKAMFVEKLASIEELMANKRSKLSLMTRRLKKLEASN